MTPPERKPIMAETVNEFDVVRQYLKTQIAEAKDETAVILAKLATATNRAETAETALADYRAQHEAEAETVKE